MCTHARSVRWFPSEDLEEWGNLPTYTGLETQTSALSGDSASRSLGRRRLLPHHLQPRLKTSLLGRKKRSPFSFRFLSWENAWEVVKVGTSWPKFPLAFGKHHTPSGMFLFCQVPLVPSQMCGRVLWNPMTLWRSEPRAARGRQTLPRGGGLWGHWTNVLAEAALPRERRPLGCLARPLWLPV